MKNTVHNYKKAIELRREGNSYTDIARILSISRTSVCNWVRNVRLTETEKGRLKKNIALKIGRGRISAQISIHSKRVFKDKVAYEEAEREFKKFKNEPLFFLGLGLYWHHGSSTRGDRVQFMSSDLPSIGIFIVWIEKYLKISRNMLTYRLFVNLHNKKGEYESIWINKLRIKREYFRNTIYTRSLKPNISKEYKGSLTISYSKIDIFRKVIAWQKLLIQYYDDISNK